jgi:hypothetical protein
LQLSAGHAQIKNQIQEGRLKVSTDLQDNKDLMVLKVEASVTLVGEQDITEINRKEVAKTSEQKI